jgi:hypothetical protein
MTGRWATGQADVNPARNCNREAFVFSADRHVIGLQLGLALFLQM